MSDGALLPLGGEGCRSLSAQYNVAWSSRAVAPAAKRSEWRRQLTIATAVNTPPENSVQREAPDPNATPGSLFFDGEVDKRFPNGGPDDDFGREGSPFVEGLHGRRAEFAGGLELLLIE